MRQRVPELRARWQSAPSPRCCGPPSALCWSCTLRAPLSLPTLHRHAPPCAQFLEHAAEEARRQLPLFSCQGLANTAWGLSKLGPLQPGTAALLTAAAEASAPRLPGFSSQELSMLLMAANSLPGGSSRALMEAAGQQLEARAASLSEWDLATIMSGAAGWAAGHRRGRVQGAPATPAACV